MLGLAGIVYLVWWFAVEWLLPGSFNPLYGRLLVVAYFVVACALCYAVRSLAPRAEALYYLGALGLVGHYFYLFHHNAADINWAVGAYVVVFALCVGVRSRPWLFAFAGCSFVCGLVVWLLDPGLRKTIFLPGLTTILVLCLVVLQSRIRLLETFAQSTDRFQSLFDATFEGVAVQDRSQIIDVNAAFVALFGYTRQELLGDSVIKLVAPEHRERVAARIQNLDESRYETVGLHKDGSRFAIEVSTKPHNYQGRTLRLAAVRDVSDRKRAEQERMTLLEEQSARASAQEALRLRDEFISIASHELRTPITSLLLHLDAFARQQNTERSAAAFERYVTRSRRQLDRMKRLVEELLDVSRLGAGQMTLNREPVELTSMVREVVDAMSEDLRRAGCQIEVRASGQAEGSWDRLRLEQVVANLVRNALIYGAGKPIELTIGTSSEGRACVSVRDYGIGIDKALQEKVFLRFERAVSSRHYGGLGLGLYIAKQIIEAHHGTIRVDSELDQGSTFSIELPTDSEQTTHAPLAAS